MGRSQWADAHDALLAEFIQALPADIKPDSCEASARFVAEDERKQWAQVKTGDRSWVLENVFYVQINPERYLALFGVDP
jgi:hypothetical protein